MKINFNNISIFLITLAILLSGCSKDNTTDDVSLPSQDNLSTAEYNQGNINKEPQINQIANEEIENQASVSEIQESDPIPETENLAEEEPTTIKGENTGNEPIDESERPPVDPSKGFSAPEFSLSTLSGSNITLSELRGKNVVLNYWKSWCIPCMEELVALENLHRTYQGQNVIILSVNGIEDDSLEDVNNLVQEKGLTYPVILDHGEIFWKSYQVLFLPTSFFIDEQGVIRDIAIGGDSEADFKLRIDQLLTDEL